METIRTRKSVENGHITVDVPAHWRDLEVEVVLTAPDVQTDSIGSGSHVIALVSQLVADGGVTWPQDALTWQRLERQERTLPNRS